MGFTASDLPYNPISAFYKSYFGEKVFKVPVSIAGDCPNRRGLKGMSVCIFCDEHGSFAYPESQKEQLAKQIQLHQEKVSKRFNSKKSVVYFQAYTTTFTGLQRIKESFEVALEQDNVVGLVVGTRPDCLSDALLDLWKETSEKTFVAVELGLQSFDDRQLDWMKRGHTAEQSFKAIRRLQQHCPKVHLGGHLMFGWPGETSADVKAAARYCNDLKLNDVKLHNLHVLRKTPLEEMFLKGEFTPVEFEEYADLVADFLSELSPEIYVHRLAALASRWDDLVAPDWTRHKMTNYQNMINHLREKGVEQGIHYKKSEYVQRSY